MKMNFVKIVKGAKFVAKLFGLWKTKRWILALNDFYDNKANYH
jgi:hypothetical protein